MKKKFIHFEAPVEQVRNFLVDIFRGHGFRIRWNGQFSGTAIKGTRLKSFFLSPFRLYHELTFTISARKEKGTTITMESTGPMWSKGGFPGFIMVRRMYGRILKDLMNCPGAIPPPDKRAARMKPMPGARKWKGVGASKALFIILIIFTVFLIFEFAAVFFVPTPDSQMSGYTGEPRWNDISLFANWVRNGSGYDLANTCFSPVALDTISKADDSVFLIIGIERVYSSVEVAAISRFLDRGGSIIVADDSDNANVLRDEAPGDSSLENSGIFHGDTLLSLDCEKHPKLVKTDAFLLTEDGTEKYSIMFNEGTALKRSQGAECQSIAVSSEYSWLDRNGNEDYDPADENMCEYDLIRMVEFDRGTALYIADSSIFINDMWTREDNSRFLRDSIKMLIGDNGTIIIDESIHREDSFIGNTVNFSVGTLGFLCNSRLFIALTAACLVCLGIVLSLRSKKIERKPHILEVNDPILLELQEPAVSINDIARLRTLIFELLSIEYTLEPDYFWEHPESLEELIRDYMIHEFMESPELFGEDYLDSLTKRCNSRWVKGNGLIRSERPLMINDEIPRPGGISATGKIVIPVPREGCTRAYRRPRMPVEAVPVDELFDNPVGPVEVVPMEGLFEDPIEPVDPGSGDLSAEYGPVEIPGPAGADNMKNAGTQISLVEELFPSGGS